MNSGDRGVRVSWTAPQSLIGNPLSGHRVRLFDGTSNTVLRSTELMLTWTYADFENLVNGHGYSFDVTAIYASGLGSPSARSAVVTPAGPTATPLAPTILSATSDADAGTATFTWQPLVNIGSTPITGYLCHVTAVRHPRRASPPRCPDRSSRSPSPGSLPAQLSPGGAGDQRQRDQRGSGGRRDRLVA